MFWYFLLANEKKTTLVIENQRWSYLQEKVNVCPTWLQDIALFGHAHQELLVTYCKCDSKLIFIEI